jgi:hypothetical protein
MEGTNRDVTAWRKSTYSADNGGNCVEVGGAGPAIAVRDTKDRAGAVLTFGADAWQRFAATIKGAD